jgi:hypothetical protein
MSWSPDPEPPEGGWSPESESEDPRPEAVLITDVAFRLRVAATPHARAKPGEQAFATYLADADGEPRPVAVGMLPTDTVATLLASDLFGHAAPLMLRATEGEEGQLRAVVSALFPQSALERFAREVARADDEPWAASVPAAPDLAAAGAPASDDDAEDPLIPFALGALLRFAENRKHPGDLAAEAADLFLTVLSGGAMDADAKKIDNLISGL